MTTEGGACVRLAVIELNLSSQHEVTLRAKFFLQKDRMDIQHHGHVQPPIRNNSSEAESDSLPTVLDIFAKRGEGRILQVFDHEIRQRGFSVGSTLRCISL